MSDEASEVFDVALGISTIYHMIEWIRWTLLITSALVGVNLIKLFNFLGVNFVIGFASLIICIIYRWGGDGPACSAEDKQPTRGLYLSL